jgi:hypothetical protein
MVKLPEVTDDAIVIAAATLAQTYASLNPAVLAAKPAAEREQALAQIFGWAVDTVAAEVRPPRPRQRGSITFSEPEV